MSRFFVPHLLLWTLATWTLPAPAQVSTNTTNSTVRFRIAYGTTLFGDIDVELFDSEKPITVSNFLVYAQSGAYSRSILHRLVPGFIVQGGGFTVASPFAGSPFQVATLIRENPAITNEFRVGTLQSNLFGTLAMARPSGDPDSATSQWFFNLGDNTRGSGLTNLNTANGGYAVFGRVTSGQDLLQQLNSRSVNSGLINMTTPLFQSFCSQVFIDPLGSGYWFDGLPVGYFGGFRCPNYTDLLSVEVILLSARDVLPPTVAISSPAENASVTNTDLTVRGTVRDNVGVAGVRVFRGTNAPVSAVVTNGQWTAVLTNFPPGTNSILAEALDTSGLRGQVLRTFFVSVRAPLSLSIEGAGTVSGATDQQLLEIGRGYRLTAKPARGNLFVGWRGDLTGESAGLGFLMASNLSLTAVFATNLFPLVKGTYAGLFHNPDQVEQESSGYVTLTLGAAGAYSARFLMNGQSYSLKGVFSPEGHETNVVARRGTNGLLVTLALDLAGGTDQLTGSITNNQGTAIDTNRGWSAELMADRAVFNPKTNAAPQAGRYTLLIPPDASSPAGPPADGFGAVSVSPKGALSFAGMLPDGTKVSQKTALSKNGEWPLYVPLAKGAGALVSWLALTDGSDTNVSGLLNWFKQRQDRARYYGAGFTNETWVVGSRFAVVPPDPVLNLTDIVVGFTNGNLAADFAAEAVLGADGKVKRQGTNQLSLTISRSTGLFTGSATPGGARKALAFKGAVLQPQGRGAGYFLGTNAAGGVRIGP